MSLETSYEVLEMLRDDGVQTFRAKEKTTGRGLELHLFLPFGRPENKLLFEKLKALPLEKRRNFLDMGIDGSTPYLVTDPLPGNRGFKGWADDLISGPQSAAAGFITGVMNAVPSRGGDDGVQILQAGQWRTGTPIPDSLITKPPTPAPPLPPPLQAPMSDTGDFTRMFKPPDFSQMAPPEPKPAPPVATPPVAAPITPPAGEFTSFFQSQSAPPPAAAPAKPAFGAAPPAGEFTGLFANKAPAATPPPPASIPQSYSPPPVTPIVKAAPEEPAPGEFTRMFQSPTKTGSYAPQAATGQYKPVSQPEPSGGQEFTKYFESPLKPAPMGSGSPQPMIEMPPPPPPSAAGKRGGEFTSVFGTPSNPPASGSPGGSFSFDSPMPQAPPPQGPVFGAMGSATGAFSAQPAWPQQQQAPPSFPSGPSEYTRMMSAQQVAQGQPQSVFNAGPNYAPPQQQVAAKKSNAVLFIVIGVVVLLIIAIVVVLVLRQQPTIPATK